MADAWSVVSETPAPAAGHDPWRVVSQKPQSSSVKFPFDRVTDAAVNAFAEPALQAVSGAYRSAVGGLKGIADLATGKGVNSAVEDIEAEQAKTYQPKSRVGRAVSAAVNYLPKKQGQLADYLGDKSRQAASALGASPETAGAI